MVGAAQLAEFAVDLAQAVPLFVRVGLLFHEAEGEAGKLFGQDGGEAVAEGEGAGRLVEGGGAVGELLGQEAGLLVAHPVLITAAGFPFGEVLFGDGVAVEVGVEDVLDLAALIEEGEQAAGGFAVLKAGTDQVAEVFGQTGDFAGAGHKIKGFGLWALGVRFWVLGKGKDGRKGTKGTARPMANGRSPKRRAGRGEAANRGGTPRPPCSAPPGRGEVGLIMGSFYPGSGKPPVTE